MGIMKEVFEMRVMLDEGAYMPERAHKADAGWDLKSKENATVLAHGSHIFDTGVHFDIPYGYVGFLKSKSGLNVKNNITGTGVIDSGYTGPVVVKLYNSGYQDVEFKEGQKLIQIVFLPIACISDLTLCDSFDETERGDKGFGSSGK